jgi:hypothetical protein
MHVRKRSFGSGTRISWSAQSAQPTHRRNVIQTAGVALAGAPAVPLSAEGTTVARYGFHTPIGPPRYPLSLICPRICLQVSLGSELGHGSIRNKLSLVRHIVALTSGDPLLPARCSLHDATGSNSERSARSGTLVHGYFMRRTTMGLGQMPLVSNSRSIQ